MCTKYLCRKLIFFLLCIEVGQCCTNIIQQDAVIDFVNNFTASGIIKNLVICYNAKLDRTGVFDIDKIIWDLQTQKIYRSQLVFTDRADSAEYQLNEVLGKHGNLVIVFLQNETDTLTEFITETLTLRRNSYIIFAVAVDINTDIRLQNGFEYLWQKKLRYPLVIDNRGHFYTMNPYPKVKVINVTTTTKPKKKFPAKGVTNMQGYQIEIPIQKDIPFTSMADDADQMSLIGLGGTIFQEFMQSLNVSIREYHLQNGSEHLDLQQVNKLLANETIEISPFLTEPLYNITGVIIGYPFRMTKRCLVKPLNNELSRDTYLLRPFNSFVWLTLVVIYILLCCNTFLWAYLYAVRTNLPFPIWQSIVSISFDTYKLLLNIPISKRWKIPNDFDIKWYSRVVLLLTLMLQILPVFIISQVYSTKLTSLLAITLYAKPQATIAQLLDANRTILADEIHVNLILDSYPELRHLIKLTSIDEFSEKRNTLDHSFDYVISEERWKYLDKFWQPQHKYFWFSNICFGTFPLQYQLREDSHFYKHLMYFSLYIHASGLHRRWRDNSSYFSELAIYYAHEERSYIKSNGLLTFELMKIVFVLLVTLQIHSFIVFIIEVFWLKLFCNK